MKKEYLGDGVYAEVDKSGYLVLTTNNGYTDTNKIELEPEVIERLKIYMTRFERA